MCLEIPLIHKRFSKYTFTQNSFTHIVKKVQDKLPEWKSKCLLMADRIVLTKSIIDVMLVYIMQVSSILMATIKDIEHYQCLFIWGHDFNSRGIHTISWKKEY